jgi:hypothetical protein
MTRRMPEKEHEYNLLLNFDVLAGGGDGAANEGNNDQIKRLKSIEDAKGINFDQALISAGGFGKHNP